MRNCAFCGADLPEHARFCGHCGHVARVLRLEKSGSAPGAVWSAQENFSSNSSFPVLRDEEHLPAQQRGSGSSLLRSSPAVWTPPLDDVSLIRPTEEAEQDRLRRALVWGVPLLEVASDAQVRGPMIQNSPQTEGAPLVAGAPSASSPFQLHHTPSSQMWPRQQAAQIYHDQPTDKNKSARTSHVRPTTPKGVMGTATRWILVLIVAIVVLTTAGVGAAFALPPSLVLTGALSGNSLIAPGQYLTLHGSGFMPGGHVTLKRDAGQSVQLITATMSVPTRSTSSEYIDATLSTSSLPSPLLNAAVAVNGTGAFDASLLIERDWRQGEHTIHATEDILSRSATMLVTIDAAPPGLSVSPKSLDFGPLQQSTKKALTLTIGNTGGKPLPWTVDSSDAKWLKVQATNGDVLPNGPPQALTVSCDTSSLKLGTYSTTLHIHTIAGNSNVMATLRVVAPSVQKQAQLSVSTSTLDFGTMNAGQRSTQIVIINNTGNLKLDWRATISDANWLSLDTTSSTILPDGNAAQKVKISVDTTGLDAGSYSTALTVNSNGGNAQLIVSLRVSASPTPVPPAPTATPILPTPVPQKPTPPVPTPTQPVAGRICKLPASLDFGKIQQGVSVTLPLSVGNCGGTAFTWQLQPDHNWVTVDTTAGTLKPAALVQINTTVNTVSLSASSKYQALLTLSTSVGNQSVTITFTVTPPPSHSSRR